MGKEIQIKQTKKVKGPVQKKKKVESSDSENGNGMSDDDEEEEEDEMDAHEYRKFLSKIFPSKHLDKKIAAGEKLKKKIKDMAEDDDEEEEEEEEKPKKKANKSNKKAQPEKTKPKKNKKVVEEDHADDEEDTDEEEHDDDDEDEDDDDDEGYNTRSKNGKAKNFNIIFTIGNGGEYEDDEDEDGEWEDYDEDEEDSDYAEETEDEDEDVSDDSDTDDDEEEEEEEEEEEQVKSKNKKRANKQNKNKEETAKENTEQTPPTSAATGNSHTTEFMNQMKELYEKNKDNLMAKECLKMCEQNVKKMEKKEEKKNVKRQAKNTRIFRKIVKDKNTMNDFEFFGKLQVDEQKKIIKELREINKITRIEKPYRLTLLESDMPVLFKGAAMKKINSLRYMEPGSGEYYKIKNWVDTFMRIPFGKYQTLPINIDNGVDHCHEFMENAMKTLDNAVYGLNDAKMQIMQMMGQLITNPSSIGTAIAIQGPMGTGKCHGINTPILMFDGTIKLVQDIQINDFIMGDDSTPRKVIELGRGEDELYEVIPVKGEKYVVNSEHILCLHQSGKGCIKIVNNSNGSVSYKTIRFNNKTYKMNYKTFDDVNKAENYLNSFLNEDNITEISIKDYLKLPKYIRKDWLKGYRVGVDFATKPVPFDPYIIGLWLGDGAFNQDACILHYLNVELKKYDLNLNYVSKYDYGISTNVPGKTNAFLDTLKQYNLINNKHIPNDYKINDRCTRMQLLAGLLDTDRSYSVKDKCFEITQKSEQLTNDILYLARSLGFAAYKKTCNKSCFYKNEKREGTYFRILISGNNLEDIPTKCKRKIATERSQTKNVLMTGINVKSIGKGAYYGFTLDGNHRYLIGDFTVTHNTTLVKEGISKILNRPFAFIALGGATDSSFLEGHSYTYEGSTWGKIVQILVDSKCMNPVIYFDELDKISDTPKGEEIAGILTHLTDTSQNSQYHDKYFAEVDFDLSKCLFIFSYNDESKVNPILRDRMYRIHTKGYDKKQKTIISNQYLLPKIREQVKFSESDIIIPDETLHYIMENHCNKEDGVRNMKRCLEIIHTKLNLYRLMKPGTNLFEENMTLKVEFPFKVTPNVVDKLITKEKDDQTFRGMYV